jgi:hypothetical protein
MNQDKAWRNFINLPPGAQRQVVDFIVFLRTRHSPSRPVGRRSQLNWQTNPSLEYGAAVRISRTATPGFGMYDKANG